MYYGSLINGKNTDGRYQKWQKRVKASAILTMTNLYEKVKTIMEGLKLNLYMLSKI